jgi:hypothetical protein
MNVREWRAVFLCAVLLAGPGICGDASPRTLLISVLQTGDSEQARELLAGTSAAAVPESGYQTATRVYGTDSVRPPKGFLQLLVIEGQAAHISSVYRSTETRFLWAENTRRRPVETVDLVQEESMSGFDVRAELHGNDVLLKLDQYGGRTQSADSGKDSHQNIRTSIYGRLGSWLDAGGSLALDPGPPVNRSYSLQRNNDEKTRLLIKVELAPF